MASKSTVEVRSMNEHLRTKYISILEESGILLFLFKIAFAVTGKIHFMRKTIMENGARVLVRFIGSRWTPLFDQEFLKKRAALSCLHEQNLGFFFWWPGWLGWYLLLQNPRSVLTRAVVVDCCLYEIKYSKTYSNSMVASSQSPKEGFCSNLYFY